MSSGSDSTDSPPRAYRRQVRTVGDSTRNRQIKLQHRSFSRTEAVNGTGGIAYVGLKRKDSYREVHDLMNNTSEYINVGESNHTTLSPLPSSEFNSLDWDPKIGPVNFSSEKDCPATGEDEVPELRTKEITRERQRKVTRQLANFKTNNELLDEHPSYHEEITGEEAEKRLKLCTKHGYLTRHSKENQQYILSVCKETLAGFIFKHFPIFFTNNNLCKKYQIGENGNDFGNLKEMLEFYEKNRIGPALNKIGRLVTESEYAAKVKEDKAQTETQSQKSQAQETWKAQGREAFKLAEAQTLEAQAREAQARAGIAEAKARAEIAEAKARAEMAEAKARAEIAEAQAREAQAREAQARAEAQIKEAQARAEAQATAIPRAQATAIPKAQATARPKAQASEAQASRPSKNCTIS